MQLYSNTINDFVKLLSTIPLEQMDSTILSPIGGRETSLFDWFSTCVMHTIHHIGQSLRIHGMVLKKENQENFERKATPSYQIIK
ncbi:MAG: DinB family protein [Candidatus Heimdallarchaeota archaeon]|nr:DinB family protein [Candidatus Heimdallarchaeota archaeon]